MGLLNLLTTNPLAFVIVAGALLYSVIAHEVAHGWAAYLFGDPTAKQSGRLSANPLRHLDPVGTLALFLVGFGWAKPVPVNYYRLRHTRVGFICVSLAGVATNIMIATIALFLLERERVAAEPLLRIMLLFVARINIILGAFNVIPIPPLDGSKAVLALLPERLQLQFARLEPLSMGLLMILLYTGALNPAIAAIQDLIISAIRLVLRA